jgi:hypothetical protein
VGLHAHLRVRKEVTMFDGMATGCCMRAPAEWCGCDSSERAVNAVAAGENARDLTAQERDWMKREAGSVASSDMSDRDLARCVLSFWGRGRWSSDLSGNPVGCVLEQECST